ncbi:ATP-binding protein [Streptomyces sp. V2I9]|uniref:ATP-binding protein n=1 Tax=Streptomyces sp. V2I9 TaxID=3042304 RepID=UPI002782797F|nr:ATP-binding protein [Streptomyces sp. V2I9]MDQ0984941.1 anti-sigma regulatory factor (Ser/Thr protein kinase) [Streptomyces sp. V2I9]
MTGMSGKRATTAESAECAECGAKGGAKGGGNKKARPARRGFGLTANGYGCLSRQFPSTPRGARLARRTVVRQLDQWGFGPLSDASCSVALVVAELAANAVCHGRLRGRNFHLRVDYEGPASRFRIEVSDAVLGRVPEQPALPEDDQESGRGLFLVESVATRWGWESRNPIGKTVWAEVAAALPGATA